MLSVQQKITWHPNRETWPIEKKKRSSEENWYTFPSCRDSCIKVGGGSPGNHGETTDSNSTQIPAHSETLSRVGWHPELKTVSRAESLGRPSNPCCEHLHLVLYKVLGGRLFRKGGIRAVVGAGLLKANLCPPHLISTVDTSSSSSNPSTTWLHGVSATLGNLRVPKWTSSLSCSLWVWGLSV